MLSVRDQLELDLKSRYLITLSLLLTLVFSGCSSYQRNLLRDTQYTESISSILITEDNKKLAVIAPKYHYVFDMPQTLPEILNSSFRKNIEANFFFFRVKNNGERKSVV